MNRRRASGRMLLAALVFPLACAAPGRAQGADLRDIPVIEVPARPGSTLALFYSGDGGWAPLVRGVARVLVDSGVAVVGVNSRVYLEHGRNPDVAAADAVRLIQHYSSLWGRDSILLVGYSRGADLISFIANRLPAPFRNRVQLVAMLGPAERASFVFHWGDLLRERSRPEDIPILPEVHRLGSTRVLCLYGRDEVESLCPHVDTAHVDVVARDGKHSFDGDHAALGLAVLRARSER